MKTTVTLTQFRDTFSNYNRKENFSYAGLEALFDMLEQYEEDCGVEIEFDCIALCCDYSEYESAEECLSDYMTADQFADIKDDDMDADDLETACLEYLQENTQVIEFNGGIIIQSF